MHRTSFLRFASLLLLPAAGLLADPLTISPFATTFDGFETTGTIQTSIFYTFNGKGWTNNANGLAFQTADQLQAQGLEDPYLQTLSNYGNGWSYNYFNGALSDDSLLAQTYDVQGPTPPAKNGDAFAAAAPDNAFSQNCVNNNNCVGQELQITYDPSGDADPVGDTVHWIQVVYTNFDGTNTYEVDNGGSADGPYYDISGAANPSGFLDIPGIADAGNSHFFDAELYLVSGPDAGSPGAVTIYGGIDWGWQNNPTPEPSTYLLAAASLGFIGWRRRSFYRRRTARSASRQISIAS
jgi:hypothetical protein